MPNINPKACRGLWSGQVRRFESLESTNTWALEHFAELNHGDVIRTDCQTAGRGRFNRAWLASPGRSLTVSVVIKGSPWLALGPNLGQIAAAALARMLHQHGVRALLKWPNDLMVNDRKIAGILVERADVGDGFVVGLGLNVNVTGEELDRAQLQRPATSMLEAAGHSIDLDQVCGILVRELEKGLGEVHEQGLALLWVEWSRGDWLKGRSIRLAGVDGELAMGEYLGISPEGGLRLRTLEGYEKVFWTGDVERVLAS